MRLTPQNHRMATEPQSKFFQLLCRTLAVCHPRRQPEASRVTRSQGPCLPGADDGDSPARRGQAGWRRGRTREAIRNGVFQQSIFQSFCAAVV